MFEIYDINNKINEQRYLRMHEILTKDYINRHGMDRYLEKKEELEGNGFNRWVNIIRNTPDYNIILYIIDNDIKAFICYMYENDNLIISEIQIVEEYRGKGLTKLLLSKMYELSDKNRYKNVLGYILDSNLQSKAVFTHVGMKKIEYTIRYIMTKEDLEKYLNKKAQQR